MLNHVEGNLCKVEGNNCLFLASEVIYKLDGSPDYCLGKKYDRSDTKAYKIPVEEITAVITKSSFDKAMEKWPPLSIVSLDVTDSMSAYLDGLLACPLEVFTPKGN